MTKRTSEIRYDPVGFCIYCGYNESRVNLTNEHIVPYSLEGIWVLPKSTCAVCADITSKIERFCAREFYGAFRLRAKIRTRRPQSRLKTVPVTISTPSGDIQTEVYEAGAIAIFPIVHFLTPGALLDPPRLDRTWEGVSLEVKTQGPTDDTSWKKLPPGEIRFLSGDFNLNIFARLCAKIGHGFAVATFGMDGFDPWLRSFILEGGDTLPYVVGCSPSPVVDGNVATVLNWSIYDNTVQLLVVDLQLFPFMGQPPIAIVVGTLSTEQYARAVDIKLRSSK